MKKAMTYNILRKHFMPRAIGIALLETLVLLNRGVIFSLLSKQILESLLNGAKYDLTQASILLLLDLSLASIGAAIAKYARVRLNCRASQHMEDAIWSLYARAENRREYSTETMLGYLDSTAAKASGDTLEYALNVYQTCLSIITTAIYACILSPWLLAVILSVTVLISLLMRKDTARLPKLYETFFEHLRVLDAKLWEQVRNHEVAGFLNLDRVIKGYENRNAEFLQDLVIIKKIDNKVQFARKYGPLFLMVLTVLCGGILSRAGYINIAEIYAILVMIPTLAGALLTLPTIMAERKEYSAAHRLLNDFFASAQESSGDRKLDGPIHSIELKNVLFSYPNAQDMALRDISLSFGPGLNCLVGPSGSGKSTLLLMLMRVLHAQNGSVLVNGRDIFSYNREDLYAHIGYSGQIPVIYQGTVRENIAQNQIYDEQKFYQLLEALQLDKWVNGLPEKENSTIDAERLSSGEKQKIALARALYRNTKLLILDEATSQMDPASEQAALRVLQKYVREKGCIVIYTAHREAFIQVADQIFCMENGTLISVKNREQNVEEGA